MGIEEHVVHLEALKSVLKMITSRDVIPSDKPLKLIREFKEYFRLFVFSFIVFDPDADQSKGEECIQIKCSTFGILDDEVQIKFYKKKCSVILKYIKDQTFRIALYIVGSEEGNFEHGLTIDIKCDNFTYKKLFTEINLPDFLERHQELDAKKFVPSHYLVNGGSCLKRLETSKQFSYYLYRYQSS